MHRGYWRFWLIVAMMLVWTAASAQTGGRSAGRSTSGPPGSGDALPHTIFVRGRVVTSDGFPPPSPAAIVSVCGGNSRREAITHADGTFSFLLGDQTSSVIQEASNTNRPDDIFSGKSSSMTSNVPSAGSTDFDTRTLRNCELRAELQDYRSSHLEFPSMPTGTVDIGVLVLRSLSAKADAMVSVTSLQAPPGARKQFDKGQAQLDKGKLDEAEGSLRKAVNEYPQYAEAWFVLGKIQNLKKNPTEAHASYEAAMTADPSYPPPYMYLAQAAAQAHQWQDALSLTDRLIALDASRYPMAHYYNAVANYNLDRLATAEVSALRAEGLDKTHAEPRIEILLGMIYTSKQNYSAAAEHYRAYLQLVPDGPLAGQVKSDLAKCEEMAKVNGNSAQQNVPKP